MNWYLRKLMARGGYMNNAGDGTNGGASGGEGEGENKPAGEGENKPAAGEGENKPAGEKKPTDEEARLLKEVMDKKAKLTAATDKLAKIESELKRFEGIDPAAVRELLKQQKDEETKKLEAKGEWDRLKAQMNEEHDKVLEAVKTEADTQKGENARLKSTIAELTVGNAFNASSFIKEDLTMPASKTRVLYGAHFEFNGEKVVAYDKPAGASDRTMIVDAKGEPMDFEGALKKIVDADPDRDQLLKSKMRPGAGSKTSSKSDTPDKKFEEPRGVARISNALSQRK